MLNELQQAIFEKIQTLGYKVYDAVPEHTEYPYIVVGDDFAIDWSTKTFPGWNVLVTIHIWSNYSGWKETKRIMKDIEQILCIQEFILENYAVAVLIPESMQVLRDPSGLRHGILRLRVKIL